MKNSSNLEIKSELYLIWVYTVRFMRYTLTRWFLSLPGSWLIRMSGRPQMTAPGGRAFDPAGQFVAVTAI